MRSAPVSSPTLIMSAAADLLDAARNQVWIRAGRRSSTWPLDTHTRMAGRRTAGLPEAYTANRSRG